MTKAMHAIGDMSKTNVKYGVQTTVASVCLPEETIETRCGLHRKRD